MTRTTMIRAKTVTFSEGKLKYSSSCSSCTIFISPITTSTCLNELLSISDSQYILFICTRMGAAFLSFILMCSIFQLFCSCSIVLFFLYPTLLSLLSTSSIVQNEMYLLLLSEQFCIFQKQKRNCLHLKHIFYFLCDGPLFHFINYALFFSVAHHRMYHLVKYLKCTMFSSSAIALTSGGCGVVFPFFCPFYVVYMCSVSTFASAQPLDEINAQSKLESFLGPILWLHLHRQMIIDFYACQT